MERSFGAGSPAHRVTGHGDDPVNRRLTDLSLPVDTAQSPEPRSAYWPFVQRALGLFACIALFPVLATIGLMVRLTSAGPILFCQERPGYRGRPFRLMKFRTMKVGTETATSLGTVQSDPAIAPAGRFLRGSKLDELPQLWNIVRGEMEFVGPRPIPWALHEELAHQIPNFDRRYAVKPGLTNVSQVAVLDNRIGEQLVADWTLRFEGELHYIENKSFAYDLIVIAMTLGFVAKKISREQEEVPARS
jgi:putative colanic acid biosynthesis UDP-glucose lipid carrier transferase